MLEMKTDCENCNKHFLNVSKEVFICSYECTFCKDCVEKKLKHICPNCNGDLQIRPIRN